MIHCEEPKKVLTVDSQVSFWSNTVKFSDHKYKNYKDNINQWVVNVKIK